MELCQECCQKKKLLANLDPSKYIYIRQKLEADNGQNVSSAEYLLLVHQLQNEQKKLDGVTKTAQAGSIFPKLKICCFHIYIREQRKYKTTIVKYVGYVQLDA